MSNFLTRSVRKEVLEIIESKYQILDVIHFFDHDYYPESFMYPISKYKNYEFKDFERILVLHHDTDYHPSMNSIGNSMFNFISCCREDHFSMMNIIFLTSHYGLSEGIKNYYGSDPYLKDLKIIETSQWFHYPSARVISEAKQENSEITHLYSCLNGIQRRHRLFTLSALAQRGLIEKGMLSYHFGN